MVIIPGTIAIQPRAIVFVPGVPTGLAVAGTGATSLSASWVAPVDDGDGALSYDLRHSTDEATWTQIDNVTSPRAITGLVSETTYFVQVRASTDAGPSAWTASVSATTPAVLALIDFSEEQVLFDGGHAMRFEPTTTGTARRAISWDNATTGTDVELLARVSAAQLAKRIGVIGRGAGAAGSETGVSFNMGATSLESSITDYSSGSGAFVADPAGPGTYVGRRYWLRARLNGADAKFKVWHDGTTEPVAWTQEVTTTVLGSGWVGLFTFEGGTDSPLFCDYYAADMAGGTAPGLADTPGVNQYATTFDEVAAVDDWTNRWSTAAAKTIVTDASASGDFAGVQPLAWLPFWSSPDRHWRYVGGELRRINSSTLLLASWANEYAPLGDLADADTTLVITPTNKDDGRIYNRMIARGSRDTVNGYTVEVLRDGSDKLRIGKLVDGTFSVVGETSFFISLNTATSLRLRCEGTSLKAKAWTTTEPADWMIEATDASHATGFWGIGGFRGDFILDRFAKFTVTEVT